MRQCWQTSTSAIAVFCCRNMSRSDTIENRKIIGPPQCHQFECWCAQMNWDRMNRKWTDNSIGCMFHCVMHIQTSTWMLRDKCDSMQITLIIHSTLARHKHVRKIISKHRYAKPCEPTKSEWSEAKAEWDQKDFPQNCSLLKIWPFTNALRIGHSLVERLFWYEYGLHILESDSGITISKYFHGLLTLIVLSTIM